MQELELIGLSPVSPISPIHAQRGLEIATTQYVPAEGKSLLLNWGFKRSEVERRILIRAH